MNPPKIAIYVKDTSEAIEFYQRIFGLELSYHLNNKDDICYYAVMTKNDDFFFSILETEKSFDNSNNPIQLGYGFDTKDELIQAFELLKANGKVSLSPQALPFCPYAALVQDQFGVNWFLTIPPKGNTPEGWNK